jgi:hypothetical protein
MALTYPYFNNGFELHGGTGMLALDTGTGFAFQNGLVATGSTQATALQLATFAMYDIDTVALNTGVALPAAIAGTTIDIYNNGAQTLTVYPMINGNSANAYAQDTINSGTSTTIASHAAGYFFCAKNGVWAAK